MDYRVIILTFAGIYLSICWDCLALNPCRYDFPVTWQCGKNDSCPPWTYCEKSLPPYEVCCTEYCIFGDPVLEPDGTLMNCTVHGTDCPKDYHCRQGPTWTVCCPN